MSEQESAPEEERILLDVDDEPEEDAPPIQIEGGDLYEETEGVGAKVETSSKIHAFGVKEGIGGKSEEHAYKRSLNVTGRGATRVRTFHTKLSDTAMNYLDGLINDWMDEHSDIEVKFSNTTVGVVEGKRAEPHLIITVWY
jgi:hypothetical protein